MDKLVEMVSQRAGIPADKARVAVDVVLGFLKKELPAPVASQIDKVVAGGGGDEPGGGIGDALGGMMGR